MSLVHIGRCLANKMMRRLEKNLSQKTLAQIAQVPLSTLQRFEHTGEISFAGFTRIGRALGYAKDLMEVMNKPKYASFDEMVSINKNKGRKRGTDENI